MNKFFLYNKKKLLKLGLCMVMPKNTFLFVLRKNNLLQKTGPGNDTHATIMNQSLIVLRDWCTVGPACSVSGAW